MAEPLNTGGVAVQVPFNNRNTRLGAQFDAFKATKQIFRSASKEILIADNYMDESLLDMLGAVGSQPAIRIAHRGR